MTAQALKQQITLKRVLVVAYVLSVLALAGFSQASEFVAMPVTKVQFDQAQQIVLVEGYRANPCQKLPHSQIVAIDDVAHKIMMRISPALPNMVCAQALAGRYDVVVDVVALQLPENVPYEIFFENAADSVAPVKVVNTGKANAFPSNAADFQGLVIKDGNQIKIQAHGLKYKVVPSMLKLDDYVGGVVNVTGVRVNSDLEPVDAFSSLDQQTGDLPLVVTGISGR